jgi:hypothetical protein
VNGRIGVAAGGFAVVTGMEVSFLRSGKSTTAERDLYAARRSWGFVAPPRRQRRGRGPVALRPRLSPGVPYRIAAIVLAGTKSVKRT